MTLWRIARPAMLVEFVMASGPARSASAAAPQHGVQLWSVITGRRVLGRVKSVERGLPGRREEHDSSPFSPRGVDGGPAAGK